MRLFKVIIVLIILGLFVNANFASASSCGSIIYLDGTPSGGGGGGQGPFPNLHIQEFNIHDSSYNLLTEGQSMMIPGQTYEIHNWPEAKEEHCMNGILPGKDTVETDTYYKIALAESDGEWQFLHRNYTQCVNMDEDDAKKEIFFFSVPEEARGKRIYFKSKVDATDEVQETDEGNNWSDVEWYPVEGSCDLVIVNARLSNGLTALTVGDHYGFEMDVLNQGTTDCPIDIRSGYYHKNPGSSTWELWASDETAGQHLHPGVLNHEYTQDSPFTASIPGTHEIMFCADYEEVQTESNEGNNCTIFGYIVSDPNQPSISAWMILLM